MHLNVPLRGRSYQEVGRDIPLCGGDYQEHTSHIPLCGRSHCKSLKMVAGGGKNVPLQTRLNQWVGKSYLTNRLNLINNRFVLYTIRQGRRQSCLAQSWVGLLVNLINIAKR